jgi:hypothetical protein
VHPNASSVPLLSLSSLPPLSDRYENECFEHLLAADMDILMGNIFIVSNRLLLALPSSLFPPPYRYSMLRSPHPPL